MPRSGRGRHSLAMLDSLAVPLLLWERKEYINKTSNDNSHETMEGRVSPPVKAKESEELVLSDYLPVHGERREAGVQKERIEGVIEELWFAAMP